ncbi:MAG: dTMP kinase [Methylococcales bacterium]|nr:dTMP kinase [Methylococcales bacterium]
MTPAQFITLEGGEGVGKSTNLDFIKCLLIKQGKQVVVTREPGGTPLAEKLRQLLLATDAEKIDDTTELLLMFAARADHIQQVIKPALAQGKWVLCDRFTDSTYAYQGGGRGLNTENIAWLAQFVQKELQPNLTFLLDAPIEIGMARAKKRGALDRFETEQHVFFNKVRVAFLKRANDFPKRIKIIDANQALSMVQENIQAHLDALI